MKAIIFDASTLISLAMNGLFEEFKELKKLFNGRFIITKEVYGEVVEKPIKGKRFQFEALRMKQLVDLKILEMPSVFGIKDSEISNKTKEILNVANSSFIGKGKEIHLIDLGEASVLALSNILSKKKIQSVAAVDERTTRMMCEKPDNLVELLQRKLHVKVKAKKENFEQFIKCGIIRSSELVYMMWKKKIIKL